MIFNSIEFAIFLVLVFLLYWYVFNKNKIIRNIFIIIVSYIFYGWWSYKFLILIAITSFLSWISGLLIVKYKNRGGKYFCVFNIILNLGILCVFKYYNFFAKEFVARFLTGDSEPILVSLILPVGISFYTFQALSYTIDVYRQKLQPTKDITSFFAYIAFFPQLVAGPIERASNLLPQFYTLKKFNYEAAVDGTRRILWGLFKKILVADSCGLIVDRIFENYQSESGSTLLVGAILFAFQIYGDFSGYSDIAIGTSRLFGFNLLQNFKTPYFSRNVGEFWRRWHISLNTWFVDYVYIPLGGSRTKKHKVIRNTFTIFLLSGLWHGANWTFIVWGGYHAFLFVPLILTKHNRKYTDTIASGRLLPSFKETRAMALTFFFVVIGWIIFRADTFTDAWHYLIRIFSKSLFSMPSFPTGTFRFLFAVTFITIMLIVEWIQRDKTHGLVIDKIKSPALRWAIYYSIIICLIFAQKSESFIYFQF